MYISSEVTNYDVSGLAGLNGERETHSHFLLSVSAVVMLHRVPGMVGMHTVWYQGDDRRKHLRGAKNTRKHLLLYVRTKAAVGAGPPRSPSAIAGPCALSVVGDKPGGHSWPLPKARALPWAAMNSSRERVPPLRVSVFLLPASDGFTWLEATPHRRYVRTSERKAASSRVMKVGGWMDGWVYWRLGYDVNADAKVWLPDYVTAAVVLHGNVHSRPRCEV